MLSREVVDRLALYASITVHVLLLSLLLRNEAAQTVYLPRLPMSQAGSESANTFLDHWLKQQIVEREDNPRWNRFGDPEGQGHAINSSPGEDLLSGREGNQDQAWLSRDPIGPGRMPEEPSPSTRLPGDGGSGGSGAGRPGRRLPPMPTAPTAAAPFGVSGSPAPAQPQAGPRIHAQPPAILVGIIPPPPAEVLALGPATQPTEQATTTTRPAKPIAILAMPKPTEAAPRPPAPPPPAPSNQETSPAAQPPAVAQAGDGAAGGGRPGPPVPAADPAPLSDSESDPFARIGSITIRAGKVDARLGRAHKIIKPRLTIKAQLDLQSIVDPRVFLKIWLNEKGKVTNVEILRSSGSNEIDLPATLAMYKSWFEPLKDKDGKPVPDIITIIFSWH